MYYWISWMIHAFLILSAVTLGGVLLRYYHLKPKISKNSSEPESAEEKEDVADEYEYDAIDPATLLTSHDER